MKSLLLTIAVVATVSAGVVIAKQNTTPVVAKQEKTINTNVVSQEYGTTVGDQSNKPADLETVKNIRRDLMEDEALSTRAKNIVVIVANNGVTLKGSVNTAAEREAILKHAYLKAPKHKIYNQISIVK